MVEDVAAAVERLKELRAATGGAVNLTMSVWLYKLDDASRNQSRRLLPEVEWIVWLEKREVHYKGPTLAEAVALAEREELPAPPPDTLVMPDPGKESDGGEPVHG